MLQVASAQTSSGNTELPYRETVVALRERSRLLNKSSLGIAE